MKINMDTMQTVQRKVRINKNILLGCLIMVATNSISQVDSLCNVPITAKAKGIKELTNMPISGRTALLSMSVEQKENFLYIYLHNHDSCKLSVNNNFSYQECVTNYGKGDICLLSRQKDGRYGIPRSSLEVDVFKPSYVRIEKDSTILIKKLNLRYIYCNDYENETFKLEVWLTTVYPLSLVYAGRINNYVRFETNDFKLKKFTIPE